MKTRCFVFMFSLSQSDRSTICVLEENVREAVREFINIDPQDRWTVEDLIGRFSRKEPVTSDDITLGYVLISFPEKFIDISVTKEADAEMVAAIREIGQSAGFKIESQK